MRAAEGNTKPLFMLFLNASIWLPSHSYIYSYYLLECISQQNLLYQILLLCDSVCAPTGPSVLNLIIDHILWTVNLHPTQSLADLVTELCHRRDQ